MEMTKTVPLNGRFSVVSNLIGMRDNLISKKLALFQPHLRLRADAGRFIVKTADNYDELKTALRLRYEVFFEELLGFSNSEALDFDRYDLMCDHLLLIDKASSRVAGTYRLNPSVFNKSFYSATEFGIGPILRLKGHKLELGRSCVHSDFRNALAIASLWRGLTEYMRLLNIKWLFGCTSLMSTDIETITAVHMHLKENHFSPKNVRVHPRIRYSVPSLGKYERFIQSLPAEKRIDAAKLVPSLLRSYIKAGALVCGAPAYDREMKCADFFTLLDTTRIMDSYDRKFNSSESK